MKKRKTKDRLLAMAPQRDGAHAVAKPTDEQKKADAEQARLLDAALIKRDVRQCNVNKLR